MVRRWPDRDANRSGGKVQESLQCLLLAVELDAIKNRPTEVFEHPPPSPRASLRTNTALSAGGAGEKVPTKGGDFKKVPQIGEKNTLFGIYKDDCCGLEIVISVGAEFPTCPTHPHRLTQWTQIEIDGAEVIIKRKPQSESAA